jgi:hypothetical protein
MFVLLAAIAVIPAQAEIVQVEIRGVVEWNAVRAPAAFNRDVVFSGDAVVVSFQVDSDNYVDSMYFPTRGYVVIPESYTLTFEAATGPIVTPFPDPYYPPGATPFFVVQNNDPRVDGFFVSTNSVDYPFSYLYVDAPARLDPYFQQIFEVSYPEDRLPSLDILDAVGFYDYAGLSRYYMGMLDAFADAMGIMYENMTISRIPVEVPVDIKPGSCPNPFNMRGMGNLPVAILGTPDLDVSTIDPASIRLAGIAPLRSGYEDVGAPFMPYVGKEDCDLDCHETESDGYMDLTLKFDTQEVVAALADATGCVAVELTGNFWPEYGGGPIAGEDVVRTMRTATTRTAANRIVEQGARPADLTTQPIRPRN